MIEVSVPRKSVEAWKEMLKGEGGRRDWDTLRTVRFEDGIEADLKICYDGEEGAWAEAVWFRDGVQTACTDCGYELEDVVWDDGEGHEFTLAVEE